MGCGTDISHRRETFAYIPADHNHKDREICQSVKCFQVSIAQSMDGLGQGRSGNSFLTAQFRTNVFPQGESWGNAIGFSKVFIKNDLGAGGRENVPVSVEIPTLSDQN